MRQYNYYLLFIFILGCNSNNKSKVDTSNNFSSLILTKNTSTDKGVIISCFRCSCIDNFMTGFIDQGVSTPVYGDTNCFKQKPLNFYCMPQKIIDSFCDRNYNAILFKKISDSNYKYKILKTEDSKSFAKIGELFFAE